MTNEQSRVLAARWIIPVSRDPINGGWIRVEEGRIVNLESGAAPANAEDLGDVALLPGLVNAHTHLEFSDCQSPIGERGVPLYQWIGQVIEARRDTRESKQAAIAAGLKEMFESGTRLVGEITTPPCDYPSDAAQPELVTFGEVLGLQKERADERLESAAAHIQDNSNAGLSPHAPYSTLLDTVDACIELAGKCDRPLAMHVAESPEERELLSSGAGPFADALRALGVWRDDLFPWDDDPFEMLIERLAKAPRALLVHGNDLNDDEIEQLRSHDNLSVVYCPRTHHFFEYERHPVHRMLAAGVRVALGTDSRASNPDLNLWREVQFLLTNRHDLAPRDVVRMATLNGADALGRRDLGRIEVGCPAAMGVVQTDATNAEDVLESFVQSEYRVIG
jgi:cytosine/adenosine deaminase-related metal-dependent hydrolase